MLRNKREVDLTQVKHVFMTTGELNTMLWIFQAGRVHFWLGETRSCKLR